MSSLEFWSGVIAVIVLQAANMWQAYQNRKATEEAAKAGIPLTNAQAQSALSDAWEGVGQEYDRLLNHYKALEEEVAVLRPLALKLALQEEAIKQTIKDKEDWKRYAEKLSNQLEELGVQPLPFRRMPSNGDSQKMNIITKEDLMEQIKKDER